MKKLQYLFASAVVAFGVTSCDMEKYPYDSLEESTYMTTLNDFANARVGLYSYYRSLTTGGYILTPEIQCDDFHAVAGFSNSYGSQYRWDFQPSDGNVESIWSSYYGHISRANYFIDSYQAAVKGEKGEFTAEDLEVLGAYAAEAYFTRAYDYLHLAGYFCAAYDAQTADNVWGVPLQTTYAPSSDASTYPGRASLKATYELIMSDLTKAEELVNPALILSKEHKAINYITKDVVVALKARAALQMQDYATAAEAATSLIAEGKYPLINTVEDFTNMWVFDEGTEVMWKIYMSPDELGSATGTTFWGQYKPDSAQMQMDYVPSQKLVDLYADADIRFPAFFAPFKLTVSTGASDWLWVFNKYPGNPELNASLNVDQHFTNMSKPFRIAEQYLIAAEAYLGLNDLANAGAYLNQLMTSRIAGFQNATYNDATILMNAIKDERHRELVGEGFRLTDLKRWGMGVKRENAAQVNDLVLYPGAETTTGLSKEANDPRMLWPIPKAEMDVNPQLKGQQNPGY